MKATEFTSAELIALNISYEMFGIRLVRDMYEHIYGNDILVSAIALGNSIKLMPKSKDSRFPPSRELAMEIVPGWESDIYLNRAIERVAAIASAKLGELNEV